ncbi:hypothetical protein [Lentilitoribacter sp. Alg239-R112]|uniref:hypothetical protein n=1 Tax=Lentilitoribacter sp. Alg239-R112 TaxID=2305987 RepID=UPI0013A6F0C5|nr:hypothetical protein [Lentilitoribacter sp. Alg239-R112]
MNFIKKAATIGIVAITCASCASIYKLERTSFYDTCIFDGIKYDIHSAVKVSIRADSSDSQKVRVLVPKGASPTVGNTIATCPANRTDSYCKKMFRRAVESQNEKDQEDSDGGSSMY